MEVIFVSILLLLTRSSTFSLVNIIENGDEDIHKGNQYRQEEFNNQTELDFNKNVSLFFNFGRVLCLSFYCGSPHLFLIFCIPIGTFHYYPLPIILKKF